VHFVHHDVLGPITLLKRRFQPQDEVVRGVLPDSGVRGEALESRLVYRFVEELLLGRVEDEKVIIRGSEDIFR